MRPIPFNNPRAHHLARLLALSLFLVFLLALVACGGAEQVAEPVSPTTAAVQPAGATAEAGPLASSGLGFACDLLTPEDAQAFLGTDAPEPTVPLSGDALYVVSSCSYRTDDNKIVLLVMRMADGNAEANRTSFEGDRSRSMENYGVDPIDVPGLAESAYWISSPQSFFNDLHFLQGDTQFVLSTSLDEKTEVPPAAMVELAQLLLSRLP